MAREKAILIVYGEGGHESEMRQLLQYLPGLDQSGIRKVAYTEGRAGTLPGISEHLACHALRDKQTGIQLIPFIRNAIFNLKALLKIMKSWEVRVVLTTGPGIAIVAALLSKLAGAKVIHIETCCRFYSKSLTGRFMYYLADHFYVQNEELMAIYPKAIWCGRV